MIALLLAAAVLADRPPELLGAKTLAEYSEWLIAETIRREPFASAQPACPAAKVEPIDWRAGPKVEGDDKYAEGRAVYEQLRFTGCGRSTVQNMLVTPLKDGGWKAAGLMPGESRADLVLQTDVAKLWFTGVQADAPAACKGEAWGRWFRRGEVKIDSPPDATTGEWVETWPATHCGEDRSISVTFTPAPDQGGTQFRVKVLWRKAA